LLRATQPTILVSTINTDPPQRLCARLRARRALRVRAAVFVRVCVCVCGSGGQLAAQPRENPGTCTSIISRSGGRSVEPLSSPRASRVPRPRFTAVGVASPSEDINSIEYHYIIVTQDEYTINSIKIVMEPHPYIIASQYYDMKCQ
jgi:hypothetical protein